LILYEKNVERFSSKVWAANKLHLTAIKNGKKEKKGKAIYLYKSPHFKIV